MANRLISPPAVEPLTLAQAKEHLRVVASDEDNLITAIIKAARLNVEAWTGRALIDQTWELVLDSFPAASQNNFPFVVPTVGGNAIEIPKPPLIAVTQFAYDDTAGDEQILDPTAYFVDNASEPGWVVPAGSTSWPSTINAINSVRIRFRAGYQTADSPADTAVPEDIKAAMKLLIGNMYEHRETQVVGTIANRLPWGVEQLLRPHRVLLGMS